LKGTCKKDDAIEMRGRLKGRRAIAERGGGLLYQGGGDGRDLVREWGIFSAKISSGLGGGGKKWLRIVVTLMWA